MKPPVSQRTGKPAREVIGVFSGPKVGKSTAWKTIAEYEHKTDSEAKFYVIDTDGDAAERLLSSSPDLTNVTVYRASDWETFREASKDVRAKAELGDWVVVDLADRVWKFVQNYYARKVFLSADEDESEYLLKLRADWEGEKKGKKPMSTIEGWDWGFVNNLYDSHFLPLILNTPAHVFVATEMADYSDDLEKDKVKRMMFGKIGVRMTGQKSLPYQVATILFLEITGGKRTITTVGDRDGVSGQRQYLDKVEMQDFVRTYLCGPAAWTLT